MAEKTIPELVEITDTTENALAVIDSGTQTFKMQLGNLGLFFRDTIIPAGITAPYAGLAAPAGWLLCDGSAISRTTYLRLFTAIGTSFGPGNGSTTFNIPDCRGRVIAGRDDMGGASANRITNAVAGIVGTTVGAVGGDQSYTPAGVNGGTQSIAHTHNMQGHLHYFPHTHQWDFLRNSNGSRYSLNSSDPSKTGIGAGDFAHMNIQTVNAGLTEAVADYTTGIGDVNRYTSGVIDPPHGANGSGARTSEPDTVDTGGMSTAATVNGSNFTFSGTPAHRVQPTMIMNYIIKT